VRMQNGMERTKAAIEGAVQPAWALLGATLVAVLAFYPIAAPTENAGEYCSSLFYVVAISLLLSWLISVTATPLQCLQMLRVPPRRPVIRTLDACFEAFAQCLNPPYAGAFLRWRPWGRSLLRRVPASDRLPVRTRYKSLAFRRSSMRALMRSMLPTL
jgi:multidrug efflux pump subunit AcrB